MEQIKRKYLRIEDGTGTCAVFLTPLKYLRSIFANFLQVGGVQEWYLEI